MNVTARKSTNWERDQNRNGHNTLDTQSEIQASDMDSKWARYAMKDLKT